MFGSKETSFVLDSCLNQQEKEANCQEDCVFVLWRGGYKLQTVVLCLCCIYFTGDDPATISSSGTEDDTSEEEEEGMDDVQIGKQPVSSQ